MHLECFEPEHPAAWPPLESIESIPVPHLEITFKTWNTGSHDLLVKTVVTADHPIELARHISTGLLPQDVR